MAVPPHHFDDEPADPQPGGLLGELERRQDHVLNQLDDLDAKLSEVLKGLEPKPRTDCDEATVAGQGFCHHSENQDRLSQADEESLAGADGEEHDDFGSAEDWA